MNPVRFPNRERILLHISGFGCDFRNIFKNIFPPIHFYPGKSRTSGRRSSHVHPRRDAGGGRAYDGPAQIPTQLQREIDMPAELAASVSRVFVTQVPHRRDQATGSYTPVFNLYPAEEFGAIVVMMPPQSAYVATSELLDQLGEKLAAYDYDRGDTVLLLGDTSLIAATVAILSRRHERFAVLRWDRILQRYSRVVFSLEGFV